MHEDPSAQVVLGIAAVLMAAKICGDIAVRLKQPAVVGELVVGVVLGNLPLLGVTGLAWVADDPTIDIMSRIGVLLLLFEVGLESTIRQMLRVGAVSLLVAFAGVIAPFGLGWMVSAWLLPGSSAFAHAFVGATLSATSVGITARVLRDLDASGSREARIILGAAVIDDVLGLIILAVISGLIGAANGGEPMHGGAIAWLIAKATLFLFGAMGLGVVLAPSIFGIGKRLRGSGVLLSLGLSVCFFFAWVASRLGLAPIVGAFAAGVMIDEDELEELVKPVSTLLVPLFFVLMGMRTNLLAFTDPSVIGLAIALTVAAIAGKLSCGGVVWERGISRASIGIGMIPRGEVGLIFANIGLSLSVAGHAVIDQRLYAAIVMMVITTTLVTPPALSWSMARSVRT